MAAIAFSRSLSPLPLDVVISEQHNSELEITEIPIESGSRITDHAFILPKRLTLEAASENAAAAYNALVAIQESRVPFTIVTGFFVYTNMLIKSLNAERDKTFSRVLKCTAELQEIIIASTGAGVFGGFGGLFSKGLNPSNAGDAITADRIAGTVMRGDAAATTVDTSILRQFAL